jgi:D-galactarolactone cycloisomerase
VRIESVKATVLRARAEREVLFAIGPYDTYSFVLVDVRTDDGIHGYGEAIARRGAEMTKQAVESLLAPVVLGKDPRNIGRLWTDMFDQLRRWGHAGGVVVEAISGVDCALWDIAGKVAGQPVWRLLHGAGREVVPVYASSVYIDDPAIMAAQAREQVDKGFCGIKVKVGRSRTGHDMRQDVDALERVREAIGDSVELMIDANGAYDAARAIQLARALDGLDVKWFEEPVPPDDRSGYLRVRAASPIPLAAGEAVFGVFGFEPLITEQLIDYAQPDLGRCGGITSAMQIASLCYTRNTGFAPHTGFSGGLSQIAALHVAAAAPELEGLEYMFIENPVRDVFVDGYPVPEDGLIRVPDSPGLGLELDLELVSHLSA